MLQAAQLSVQPLTLGLGTRKLSCDTHKLSLGTRKLGHVRVKLVAILHDFGITLQQPRSMTGTLVITKSRQKSQN